MSSGYGAFGGRGRCFPLFEDFQKCMSKAETPFDCKLPQEDYFECLHHKKEFTRLNEINAAREAKAAHDAKQAQEEKIASLKAKFAGTAAPAPAAATAEAH